MAYLSQPLLGISYHVTVIFSGSASFDVIDARLRRLGILDEIEIVDGRSEALRRLDDR